MHNLFTCWNVNTGVLAAVVNAPSQDLAERIAKNEMGWYCNAKATASDLQVREAKCEEVTSTQIDAAQRFGVWLA
jgi:hypothetical protein